MMGFVEPASFPLPLFYHVWMFPMVPSAESYLMPVMPLLPIVNRHHHHHEDAI
jgi:hypothetical protein